MILGLFIIVATAFLNAVIVLAPMLAVRILAELVNGFLRSFKVRNDVVYFRIQASLIPLGIFFAAALQARLWHLVPHTEPWRWTFAAAVYLLGAFVLLLWQIPLTNSPLERAWVANRFTIGGVVMLATLAASFYFLPVYEVVATAPDRVLRFVIGDTSK